MHVYFPSLLQLINAIGISNQKCRTQNRVLPLYSLMKKKKNSIVFSVKVTLTKKYYWHKKTNKNLLQ